MSNLWVSAILDLTEVEFHNFSPVNQCQRNRTVRGWVINDLALFRSALLVFQGPKLIHTSSEGLDQSSPNLKRHRVGIAS